MELKEFVCPNCKAPLVPIKDARFMFCDYCGTRIVIDDIDFYRENSRTERERIRTNAEVELQRLKNEKHKNVMKIVLAVIIAYVVICIICLVAAKCAFDWYAMLQ